MCVPSSGLDIKVKKSASGPKRDLEIDEDDQLAKEKAIDDMKREGAGILSLPTKKIMPPGMKSSIL